MSRWPVLACCLLWLSSCSSGSGPADAGADGDAGNGGGDITTCQTDSDCPQGQDCLGGICQPVQSCQCNYDCGTREAGLVCNRSRGRCEPGATGDTSCNEYCDCFASETCAGGQCQQAGGDEKTCTTEEQCDSSEQCLEGRCVPRDCSTREDCAAAVCLVCSNGVCQSPPAICQGNADCCLGFHCNFGSCIPDSEGCQSDADCPDPEFPRCREGECVPECVNDAECAGNQQCRDNHCVDPGCSLETCPQGQWCNPTAGPAGAGECQDGCDQNSDCPQGKQCNYESHVCVEDCCGGCGADEYCDSTSCTCKPACSSDDDCQPGQSCNQQTGQCETHGAGQEGDDCLSDADCDDSQGLLCDDWTSARIHRRPRPACFPAPAPTSAPVPG